MSAFLPALGAFMARPEVLTGLFGLGASAINHMTQRSLSNNAFRQNVAMWQAQNQYNSPSAQVGRLIAAGLNPALAYGGSSQVVGNSDTPPQLDYSGVAHQPLISPDAVMQAQQVVSMDYQRRLLASQVSKNEAETIESLNRGKLSGAEADYAKEFAIEKLESMRLMNDKTYLECEQVDETINNIIATRNLTKEQIRSLELANELNDRIMEAKVHSYELQNRESLARTHELLKRTQKYSAEIGVLQQEARKLSTENSFLPGLLTTNLAQGISSIQKNSKEMERIDAEVSNIAVQTGIHEKELKNWFWTNIFMPYDLGIAKNITTLAGAGALLAK